MKVVKATTTEVFEVQKGARILGAISNMNFKSLSIIAGLSVFGFAAAEENINPFDGSLDSTAACTRDLEGIVYQPETPGRAYFDRISEQIKIAGPVLWSSQADAFLANFQAKYGVQVTIMNPFREVVYPSVVVGKFYYPTTSTANMNGSGFLLDTDTDQRSVYEFIVYNPLGELKYVLLTLPLADTPEFKK